MEMTSLVNMAEEIDRVGGWAQWREDLRSTGRDWDVFDSTAIRDERLLSHPSSDSSEFNLVKPSLRYGGWEGGRTEAAGPQSRAPYSAAWLEWTGWPGQCELRQLRSAASRKYMAYSVTCLDPGLGTTWDQKHDYSPENCLKCPLKQHIQATGCSISRMAAV